MKITTIILLRIIDGQEVDIKRIVHNIMLIFSMNNNEGELQEEL